MPKAAARTVSALFVLLASLAWPAVGSGQEPTGFRTPGYGARRDIAEGPGNAMWFRDFSLAGNVDQAGAIQAFSVASDGPGGIAVGADGNLEVHTRITDTQTGFSNDYSNAQGTPFEPIQDTAALSVCP